jgi:NAD-dependent deacetylase
MNWMQIIEEKISKIKKIVFVTGAGISHESGIPTFRGKEGLWRNHDAMKLATIDAFYENPEFVWEWYNERRVNIFQSNPNNGHLAIAKLQEIFDVVVLTQNVDGLHKRAGSEKIYELHGNITKIRCISCNFKEESLIEFFKFPPKCKCGAILRPDVVWFGESLPQDVWNDSIVHASESDLMVIVGTSLVVSPANTLPLFAKQNGSILMEINPQKTEMSDLMDISIEKKSAEFLPEFVNFLEKIKS